MTCGRRGVAAPAAIGRRTRQWRLVWLPLSVTAGRSRWRCTCTVSQGLASDLAPARLWLWAAGCVGGLAVAVLGWRGARWRRRAVSMLAIPLTLAGVLLTLNQWVGYYPTVQAAWNALTAGPLPDEVDAAALPGCGTGRPVHRQTGQGRHPVHGQRFQASRRDTCICLRHGSPAPRHHPCRQS